MSFGSESEIFSFENLDNLAGKKGIYAIINNATGRLYIGQTVNLRKRLRRHLKLLNLEKHPIRLMQYDFTEQKGKDFAVKILEPIEPSQINRLKLKNFLLQREKYWLDQYNWEICYNYLKLWSDGKITRNIPFRKYWSKKRETLTVKTVSIAGEDSVNRNNFRNELRAFLYQTPEGFPDLVEDAKISKEKMDSQVSIEVRAYEKEFFYLKCMKLEKQPHDVLRALLLLSMEREWKEVYTSPELLFSLLSIQESTQTIYKKGE
ncbi:MAG: GIY-YIG nuclease family protein [Candidatus Odinarchaeota archaeon]